MIALAAYLEAQECKSVLRFITCGSVDDGKSTLIGRLLYDANLVLEDQLTSLKTDSERQGRAGGTLDVSLLLDGLSAEREQGITIDVAYRYFTTSRRKFIVADTPGHEQYTRNMATGASGADLALILVDARKGVQAQTRRHSFVVSVMGIRHVVLAVNKMDLVGFDQARFAAIEAEYRAFAAKLDLTDITAVPISALTGANIATKSTDMPWHSGPGLLTHLETIAVAADDLEDKPFRMPVQWVNRPDQNFRGIAGRIVSGRVAPGDRVRIAPRGSEAKIERIVTMDGDLPQARAGQSVTLTLNCEIDCSRGDVIVAASAPAEIADQFQATLIWMSETPLFPGRRYLLKHGARTVSASITDIRYRYNVETLEHVAARQLALNDIAVCNLSLEQAIAFEPYSQSRELGAFVLIDPISNETIGAGTLTFALRRAHNIHWQAIEVDRDAHARIKGQKPLVLWFTGLSGAGKSTIANLVEKKLYVMGKHTILLDGDNVRHGLNRDLGFSDADRVENIRRVAEVAKLMTDAGLIVLASFISPFRSERDMARALFKHGEFLEVFVDVPLAVAEARDAKGLYKKARAGLIKNFTGLDSPYEAPAAPDIYLDSEKLTASDAADQIVAAIVAHIGR
ncbi:sulfate adenylyltransferase subunit 1 [alpha proteobacterium U9-1i]|nr:sulfate adenylyltransferase subunit 1 [alpha proteobacterium U9-1i]